jgi:dihydroorotase-like cyclic amidohydrolase
MALQKFPGFIDIHVHLRDPGATHKEDFSSGSRAAVLGGFTFLVDMPNNPTRPTISIERLEEKKALSLQKAICDIGFHYGTDGNNIDTFAQTSRDPHVFGLKIYCNHTTGELLVEEESKLVKIFAGWESEKPILVHAEGDQLSICLALAKKYAKRLHVCHLSDIQGVELVRKAKEQHQGVTAGVTPHHLFLKPADMEKLASFGAVKPAIEGADAQSCLWEAVKDGTIDIVESDHAPHTKDEKLRGTHCFGVPGLETTNGLLMSAVVDGRLTLSDVIGLIHEKPKKIFAIPDQLQTFIELDPQKSYISGANGYESKCGWSPFEGWELFGKVEHVVLRGKEIVRGGKII